jgi:hypothetical protein
LVVGDYADEFTRGMLGGKLESICVVVGVEELAGAVDGVVQGGYHVVDMRMVDDGVFGGSVLEKAGYVINWFILCLEGRGNALF